MWNQSELDRRNHNRCLCRFLRWFSGVAEDPVRSGCGWHWRESEWTFPDAHRSTGRHRCWSLSRQDQQNGGVQSRVTVRSQESGNGQQSDQDEKGEAWHGFGVSGACEGSRPINITNMGIQTVQSTIGSRTIFQTGFGSPLTEPSRGPTMGSTSRSLNPTSFLFTLYQHEFLTHSDHRCS